MLHRISLPVQYKFSQFLSIPKRISFLDLSEKVVLDLKVLAEVGDAVGISSFLSKPLFPLWPTPVGYRTHLPAEHSILLYI